jgi:hypothetical protein
MFVVRLFDRIPAVGSNRDPKGCYARTRFESNAFFRIKIALRAVSKGDRSINNFQ